MIGCECNILNWCGTLVVFDSFLWQLFVSLLEYSGDPNNGHPRNDIIQLPDDCVSSNQK